VRPRPIEISRQCESCTTNIKFSHSIYQILIITEETYKFQVFQKQMFREVYGPEIGEVGNEEHYEMRNFIIYC
jgi:hypothetical protein